MSELQSYAVESIANVTELCSGVYSKCELSCHVWHVVLLSVPFGSRGVGQDHVHCNAKSFYCFSP